MSEFPGYIVESEARQRQAERQTRAAAEAQEQKVQRQQRACNFVIQSLPLLTKYAKDTGVPVEMERGRFVKRVDLERGWVVRSIYHPETEASRSGNSGDSTTYFVLTESGVLGSASPVDRGIRAYKMSTYPRLPDPITPDEFALEKHALEVVAGITGILTEAGVPRDQLPEA